MKATNFETMSIRVDSEKRRSLFAQWGVLDRESAIRSYSIIHQVEGFDPSFDTLVDYRGITEVDLGFEDLKSILQTAKNIEKRTGRGALVVGPDAGRLIFTKLFCTFSTQIGNMQIRYRAFPTIEDAEKWLDSDN